MDLEDNESVLRQLRKVKQSLEQQRSTLTSTITIENALAKLPFYIHVESRPVKKDRQACIAGGERDKHAQRAVKRRRERLSPSEEKALNEFKGSPFNTQALRFDNKGLHPRMIRVGQCCMSTHTELPLPPIAQPERPSSVNTWMPDDFHRKQVLTQQQNQAKMADDEMLAKRGPGTYNLPPINTRNNAVVIMKPQTDEPMRRGKIHRSLIKRVAVIPGPGTYKPHSQHCSPREGNPPFDSSLGHDRNIKSVGSGLPPGLHNTERGTVGYRVKQQVGTKGPYQTFSSQRFNQFCTSNCAETDGSPHLGPGAYNPSYQYNEQKVDFRRRKDDNAAVRNWGFGGPSIQQAPRTGMDGKALQEGTVLRLKVPHTVTAKPSGITKKSMAMGFKWVDKYGFLSSSKLRDKIIEETWPMNNYMSGPGRYACERYDKVVHHRGHARGHKSVFDSKTAQRMEFGMKHPEQLARERNKINYRRKKARLDEVMLQEIAFHKRRRMATINTFSSISK